MAPLRQTPHEVALLQLPPDAQADAPPHFPSVPQVLSEPTIVVVLLLQLVWAGLEEGLHSKQPAEPPTVVQTGVLLPQEPLLQAPSTQVSRVLAVAQLVALLVHTPQRSPAQLFPLHGVPAVQLPSMQSSSSPSALLQSSASSVHSPQ
jgi:hypothetical protein